MIVRKYRIRKSMKHFLKITDGQNIDTFFAPSIVDIAYNVFDLNSKNWMQDQRCKQEILYILTER